MGDKTLLIAAAFMLIFEGLMPLIAPNAWRDMFQKISQLPESYIRLGGAVSVLLGLALYWLFTAQ